MDDLTFEEYKKLVDHAPIMIWRSDTTSKCDYFNLQWLQFTGKKMEDEIGDGWAKGVHPDDFDRCLNIYTSHFKREDAFEMEYRLLRHDGEYRWILDRGTPFYINDEFGGFIGSCTDITDQKMAKQALEVISNDGLEQFLRLIPICAWCKQVNKSENEWKDLEDFMINELSLRFSHWICPTCSKQYQLD